MAGEDKRILVFAIRAIGDAVLITPIVRILKRQVPAAYVAVVADGSSAEVLRNNPHVDRILVLNRRTDRDLPWQERVRDMLGLVKELRAEQFDISVDLFSGPRSAVLAWLCGAPERYGEDFRRHGRGFLYNHPIQIVRNDRHLIEQKLQLIRSLVGDVDLRQSHLEVALTQEERKRARDILARYSLSPPRLVGLIPGAGSVFRRWPPDRFATIGDCLVQNYHAKILLLGGQEDCAVCQRVSDFMNYKPADLSGQTSLRELAALFMELDLVISNVTGPMHLAVATAGPKVIGLFGAADVVQYAPWGATGIVLTKGKRGQAYWQNVDYRRDFEEYLLQITVEDVLCRVRALMPRWEGETV